MLQGSAVNAMNGLLLQLSQLSVIANELFTSVIQQSQQIQTRIQNISTKLKSVSEKLPQMEKYCYEKNSQLLYTNSSYILTYVIHCF